jgi:hypothetical protein
MTVYAASAPYAGHPAVPVRRDRPQDRRAQGGGRRRHLVRHRRPRPAHPRLRGREAGQGGRRSLDPPVPELLRAGVVPAGDRRLLPAPVRGRAGPGHPGPAPDRLQGGDRPPAVGVRRPGRPGAGDRARLPGLRGRDHPGRRRAGPPPAHRRGRLVPRLRRRRPGGGPWGQAAVALLPVEPDRSASRPSATCCSPTTTPTPRSPTTASSPRRSSRSRAPPRWPSSSARCPRSST